MARAGWRPPPPPAAGAAAAAAHSRAPVRGVAPSPPRALQQQQPDAGASPTPLLDAVAERGGRSGEAPFHVPGHKRGGAAPPALRRLLGDALRYDLTELAGAGAEGSSACLE